MRKTAFFMENIDHLPSKELLMQAGFTEQDINQEIFIGRKSHGNSSLLLVLNFCKITLWIYSKKEIN